MTFLPGRKMKDAFRLKLTVTINFKINSIVIK